MCIVHLQPAVWDGFLECLCCILLLIHFHPETLPFPLPRYPHWHDTHKPMLTHKTCATIMHTQKKRTHTPTHTLQTWASYSSLPHRLNVFACRFMCVCVGAFMIVESPECDIFSSILPPTFSPDTAWLIALLVFQVSNLRFALLVVSIHRLVEKNDKVLHSDSRASRSHLSHSGCVQMQSIALSFSYLNILQPLLSLRSILGWHIYTSLCPQM